MPPSKIILDTDPGVDDILAVLLALSASDDELAVLLISLTYGNTDIEGTLRNVVSAFHVVEKEQQWRKERGQLPGFGYAIAQKPMVAVGACKPSHDQEFASDFFYGADGLGGLHTSHPHYTPEQAWMHLFKEEDLSNVDIKSVVATNFVPSKLPSHKEILNILRENEDQSVTIVAVGPLTNLALALEEDPETFLRAKEVVCMGGALNLPGNMTPFGEFNIYADAFAAAKLFALTSQQPMTTMPPIRLSPTLGAVLVMRKRFTRPLDLKLFPLDITVSHTLSQPDFRNFLEPLLEAKSPLATWANVFMTSTFDKVASQLTAPSESEKKSVPLNMHDPLTIWYVLKSGASDNPRKGEWVFTEKLDLRVEPIGQWTRGMLALDRRQHGSDSAPSGATTQRYGGNNVVVCEKTGWEETFATNMLQKVFLPPKENFVSDSKEA